MSDLITFKKHYRAMRKKLSFPFFLLPLLNVAQSPQLVVPIGHNDEINAEAFFPSDNGNEVLRQAFLILQNE